MIVTAQSMNYEVKIYNKCPQLGLLGGVAWEQISHESISKYIDQKQSNNHFKNLKIFEASTPARGSLNIVFAINAKRFSNLWKMAVMSRWSRLTAGVLCIS